jgi:hypothetical protein
MSERLPKLEQKNLNPQSPARENLSILTLFYRFVIVTSLASSVLAVIIFAFVLFLTPQLEYLSDAVATRTNTTSKVLGAQTNNKDDSILGRIVRVILSPIGRANIWLINLAAVDDPSVLDPLPTTELNEVFEYDATGNKVIVKKQLVFEEEAAAETGINWTNITGAPDFLTTLNELTGDDGNIDLVEGDNIEITSNKSKNTLTIAGTLVSSSPGISEINLTAGTGISISGTSPDFTIANTNLGSSQNIFKRLTVSGQNTIVADSNNDTLTFAAGANMAITTSAGNDRVTFAVTGSVANADTLDLLDSTDFALSALTLTAGTGLTGSGDLTANRTFNVVGGNGITANADDIELGDLSSDWDQNGAWDIILDNWQSELRIAENNVVGTEYGTFDVANLTGNRTYTFPDTAGTVCISGGTCDASTLDTFDSTQFLRSDTGDNFTSGTLTTDAGTTLDVNGTLAWGGATISESLDMANNIISNIGAGGTDFSGTGGLTLADDLTVNANLSVLGAGAADDDFIYFDTGTSESLSWDDNPGEFDLSGTLNLADDLIVGSSASNDTDYIYFDDGSTESLYWFDALSDFWFSDELVVQPDPKDFSADVEGVTVNVLLEPTGAETSTFIAFKADVTPRFYQDLSGASIILYDADLNYLTSDPSAPRTLGTLRHYSTNFDTFDSFSSDNLSTITNYTGLYIANPDLSNTSSAGDVALTTAYGVYIQGFTEGEGDIGDFYGVYIGDSESNNTPYGIYQVGTDDYNYFGGNVGVGDNTPTETLTVADDFVGYAGSFFNDGNLDTHEGVFIQGCLDTNPTAACNFLELRDGNGTVLGAIEGNGAGAVTNASAGSDYAELFRGNPSSFETGDVIAVGTNGGVAKAAEGSNLLGVFSTNSNNLGNWQDGWENTGEWVAVGLLGQISTKFSGENGDISPGDPLTSSSMAGVATKATKSGPIIGKALEAYSGSGVGKIMVFVSVGWYVAPIAESSEQIADLSSVNVEALSAGTITTQVLIVGDRKLDMAPDGTLVVDGSVNVLGDLSIEGDVETTGELTTRKLNVGEEAAGSAVLEAGETKVVVETQAVTGKSQVLITPNTLTEKNLTVTKKEADKGFTVEIVSPESKDIEFDWLIVN